MKILIVSSSLILVIPITVLVFCMILISYNLNPEESIDLMTLVVTSIGTMVNLFTLGIAYKAYENWHKSNTHNHVLSERKEFFRLILETENEVINSISNAKTVIENTVGATINFAPIVELSLAATIFYKTKSYLSNSPDPEIILFKPLTEASKYRETLFLEGSEDLEKEFLRFQARIVLLARDLIICKSLIRRIYNNRSDNDQSSIIECLREVMQKKNNIEEIGKEIRQQRKILKKKIESELSNYADKNQ